MTDPPPLLPFEFVVTGRPVSHQTGNRPQLAAWRTAVRAAAAAGWGGRPPLATRLRIAVAYYHPGRTVRLDGDNLLKPIQDALTGVVYDDDRRLTDADVRKTPLDTPIRVPGASLVLMVALQAGAEFVHVTAGHAPDHSTPLG